MIRFIRIGLFLILFFLIIIRFFSLDIDPPLFFAGFTQSHLTDPYQVTFFSRNAILFNDWDPFNYHRWDIFKFSLVSGFSYIIFSIAGVSRSTANLSGIILNLGGLFLFICGFYRIRPNREVLINFGLLLLSGMLLFYGRLPFAENGLIFLAGLLTLVFFKFFDKWWGQILAGCLVAAAAWGGKLFGIILLGPVILSLIYRYKYKSLTPVLRVLLGCAAGSVLFLLIFYGGNLQVIKLFFSERANGMLESNTGIFSLPDILSKILMYGAGNGFFELSPFFVCLAGICLIGILLTFHSYKLFERERMPLIFIITWLICGVLALMPFYYRPLRYAIFLFLPMAALCAYGINLIDEAKIKISQHNRALNAVFIFFTLWFIFTHIPICFVPHSRALTFGKSILPLTFLATLIVMVPLYLWLKKGKQTISRKTILIIILPLLAGVAIRQGVFIYSGMTQDDKYLAAYNIELKQLVNEKAIISGPYAAAFTIDNDLSGIIYYFGFSNIEYKLFENYPITHIATDNSNWDMAIKDFPFLNQSTKLADFIVRDFPGKFYRLVSAKIPLTDYEMGMTYLNNNEPDSALIYFRQFTAKYPENLFGQFALIKCYKKAGQMDNCYRQLKMIVDKYPDNFRVHIFSFNIFAELYRETKNNFFQNLAIHHFERAHELNPTLN